LKTFIRLVIQILKQYSTTQPGVVPKLVFWSRAQHHVTTSLMKLTVGERNVATKLGTTPGCVVEYCFSIINIWLMAHHYSLFRHSQLTSVMVSYSTSPDHTTLQSQHFRSSGLLCCRSDCLELTTGQSPQPGAQQQQLQTIVAENEPISSLPLSTHSAVETLHDSVLYKAIIDTDCDCWSISLPIKTVFIAYLFATYFYLLTWDVYLYDFILPMVSSTKYHLNPTTDVK